MRIIPFKCCLVDKNFMRIIIFPKEENGCVVRVVILTEKINEVELFKKYCF